MRKKPAKGKGADSTVSYAGTRWLNGPRDFFGQYVISEDGRYGIATSDSDGLETGGCRESGHGRVLSFTPHTMRLSAETSELERPINPSASNVGLFTVEDWHSGSDLGSSLYVLDETCRVIRSWRMPLNLFGSGISRGGTRAFLVTCGGTGPEHEELEDRVMLFDVATGKVLSKTHFLYERPPSFAGEELVFELRTDAD